MRQNTAAYVYTTWTNTYPSLGKMFKENQFVASHSYYHLPCHFSLVPSQSVVPLLACQAFLNAHDVVVYVTFGSHTHPPPVLVRIVGECLVGGG